MARIFWPDCCYFNILFIVYLEESEMPVCTYFKDCEFVLQHIPRVAPHWNDFVNHYCQGDFQDVCKRLQWIEEEGTKPPAKLMPTGHQVPDLPENM